MPGKRWPERASGAVRSALRLSAARPGSAFYRPNVGAVGPPSHLPDRHGANAMPGLIGPDITGDDDLSGTIWKQGGGGNRRRDLGNRKAQPGRRRDSRSQKLRSASAMRAPCCYGKT